MKIVVSHPTGNTNVRGIVEGLHDKNMLYQFYTTIACFPNNFWDKAANIKGLGDLKRRSYKPELQPLTKQYPFRELGRTFANRFGFKALIKHETGRFSTDKIYASFDKYVATNLKEAKKNGATAVYAYEDGALETFIEAKKIGLTCIYDLPIAYHETLQNELKKELDKNSSWASTLGGGIKDSQKKLGRKKKELELAEIVVVASDFVRNSLPKWALNKKIIQSPFGTPNSRNGLTHEKKENKRLKVLFVGSMTQRKGLKDLFNAIKHVDKDKVELVVLGSLVKPLSFYKNIVEFTHKKTRPHKQVLELMRSCDVFCLPSLIEGRALVMQEAMSQGLPLIITANTGGEDLIQEGETGFLVPTNDSEAIANKIKWFVDNKAKIKSMGEKAKNHAMTYTWENYSKKIIREISVYQQ